MIAGEGATGAGEACLDLVGHHQHLFFGAQVSQPCQEVLGRKDDTALALDGLEENGDDRRGDRLPQRIEVAVGDADEPGVNGPWSAVATSSSEKLTIVVVRRWKLPCIVTMVALSGSTPLTGNFEAVTVDAGSSVLRSCADPRRNGAADAY